MDARPLHEITEECRTLATSLSALARQRVRRDEALTMVSDLYVLLQEVARQMGSKGHGFSERPVRRTDDDEEDQQTRLERVTAAETGAVSLVDVLAEEEDERPPSQAVRDLVTDLMEHSPGDAARIVQTFVRSAQAATLRSMISYIWHDAGSPWEMMKRCLAITRRYQRNKLRGISMTEVSLLLNETRAAPSARERDVHDELLIRWGVRAPKAADAGLKSVSACQKSRRAAMGNHNRRDGKKQR